MSRKSGGITRSVGAEAVYVKVSSHRAQGIEILKKREHVEGSKLFFVLDEHDLMLLLTCKDMRKSDNSVVSDCRKLGMKRGFVIIYLVSVNGNYVKLILGILKGDKSALGGEYSHG
jgi:hypothetical protein